MTTEARTPAIPTEPLGTPLLVFGGPYSNVRAVTALRAQAATLGIDAGRIICTGDVVAYCAEPEETVAAVRAWGCHVVAGNCEEQLARDADDCECGFARGSSCDRLAKGWYAFARRRISAHSRAWMAGLPKALVLTVAGRTVRVVHGGIDRINRFVFASQRKLIAAQLEKASADIVIAGHAGVPFIARVGQRVWFNPGVIGMPANDGTPDVWYGLVETRGDDLILSTQRLAYDSLGAATAMRRPAHADGYAEALLTGRWPSIDVLPRREREASGKEIAQRTVRIPSAKAERAGLPNGFSVPGISGEGRLCGNEARARTAGRAKGEPMTSQENHERAQRLQQ
jgi:predicted phosphodiesterase